MKPKSSTVIDAGCARFIRPARQSTVYLRLTGLNRQLAVRYALGRHHPAISAHGLALWELTGNRGTITLHFLSCKL
ncbi:hypothetical protein KCP73_07885 [Salmonella enterica subsp. enterica]|nr:hypothetical protein KCP73_07885 [Salmonella enterica subsp. enterica]